MTDVFTSLSDVLKEKSSEVEAWFGGAFSRTPPFFYNSVDIRFAGFKLAPVDTNLFPGGFNNLNAASRKRAAMFAKTFFSEHHPDVSRVLVLAENHTRNLFYLEHLVVLVALIEEAGMEVRLTSLAVSEAGEGQVLISQSGQELAYVPCEKKDGALVSKDGFVPDMVLVNNDLSKGAPELLCGISQIVTPPVGFGWYRRRKTSHFDTYSHLVNDFARHFDIDPWLLSAAFHKCGMVNFREKKGIECVAKGVDTLLSLVQKKYTEYGIKDTPYVFIKSNMGTYGMGVMTARSGDEVLEINKKARHKMNVGKEGLLNTEVIIQEGVPTIDEVDGYPAEAMMNLVGGQPVGCIYRYNTKKDKFGNLNSSGMQFKAMEDEESCMIHELVARLASYAAAWECYVESYQI